MNNFIFFVDTLCSTIEYYDEAFETTIVQNVNRLFDFFISSKEIFQKSCLYKQDYESVVVNLIICNNEKIHDVNKEYRKIDRPTDVISFALYADTPVNERFVFDGEINLGDVFLSIEQTKIQSVENKTGFAYEFYYLIAHSLLHLLGFDHQDEISYNFMVNAQKKALECINV